MGFTRTTSPQKAQQHAPPRALLHPYEFLEPFAREPKTKDGRPLKHSIQSKYTRGIPGTPGCAYNYKEMEVAMRAYYGQHERFIEEVLKHIKSILEFNPRHEAKKWESRKARRTHHRNKETTIQ